MKKLCLALAILILSAGPVLAQYSFQFEVPEQGAIADLVQLASFHNVVTNTGSVSDTYDVTVVKDMPPDWVGSLCLGTLCYPPFITAISFTLAPGESTDLLMDITPLTDLGSGTAALTLSSQGQPGLTETRTFTVLTPGLDILLVDGDGGAAYETYYQDAIAAQGLSYGRWNRQANGALSTSSLASFGTVVWLAGDNPSAMTAADLTSLQAYLWEGGNLIISGQNLARDFCSPGGSQYSAANRALFNSIFGVDFNLDDAGVNTAVGLAGDPVADGLVLTLSGGSGADANTSPDGIITSHAGIPSMVYAAGGLAAVRSGYNHGNSFFMGFGFENISSAASRQLLLSKILAWLPQGASAAPEAVPPLFATAPAAAPNPFNPRTHIRFVVGGQRTVIGSVTVYDVTGRRIRALKSGVFAPGPVDLAWDGTDSRGTVVAGGLYLTRIVLDGQTKTVKLTLAK